MRSVILGGPAGVTPTKELGQHTVGNFLLISTFLVDVLLSQQLCDIRWALHEDVPLASKEDFDGSLFMQQWRDVTEKHLLLIDIHNQG